MSDGKKPDPTEEIDSKTAKEDHSASDQISTESDPESTVERGSEPSETAEPVEAATDSEFAPDTDTDPAPEADTEPAPEIDAESTTETSQDAAPAPDADHEIEATDAADAADADSAAKTETETDMSDQGSDTSSNDVADHGDRTEAEVSPSQEIQEPSSEPAPEQSGSSFASTALMLLVLVLVVIGLTLWAGPKLAPHLPAPVAQYLNPIPDGTAGELTALGARLADVEGQLDAAAAAPSASLDEALAALEGRTAALEGGAGAEDALSMATALEAALEAERAKLTALETQVSGLEGELRALTTALTAGQDGAPVAAELQAALQALQSRVDTIAATVTVIPDLVTSDQAAGFATRDELSAGLAEVSAGLEGATTTLQAEIAGVAAEAEAAKLTGFDALRQAETAVAAAALRGAERTLASRVSGGLPFAGALEEVAALGGQPAPETLAGLAASGIASLDDLSASLPDAARVAINAERRAEAGDSTGGQIAAWFDSQIQSRPTVATEGTSAAAVISRVEAALETGDLPSAIAEAEALSPAAAEAMAPWLGDLTDRVAAEEALASYLTTPAGAE